VIRVVIETDLGFERRRIGSCLVNLPGPAAEVALFDNKNYAYLTTCMYM